jgi:DNA polymerase-3 subunit alpha/error-prone DNA polymerase
MCFLRSELERQGVLSARSLARVRHGRRARTAGLVTVSQRPRTAKGFYFITLEDETGFANIIVTPPRFESFRPLLLRAAGLQIAGVVQNQEGVVHLKADTIEALRVAPARHARRFG